MIKQVTSCDCRPEIMPKIWEVDKAHIFGVIYWKVKKKARKKEEDVEENKEVDNLEDGKRYGLRVENERV